MTGLPVYPCRFIVIPANAGIQAEVAGVLNQPPAFKGGGAILMDCHSRLGGNGLNTPLDSGFRRNDG